MRHPVASRFLWTLAALLAWTIAPPSRADTPAEKTRTAVSPSISAPEAPSLAEDARAALHKGIEIERRRDWAAAIELYEDALVQWPGDVDLRRRLRLCESHYRLGRRYQDHSFRDVLLRLPRDQALELYSEVIERIQTHYVESVALEPLLRRGLDNLEVALRDPVFLEINARGANPEQVLKLRRLFSGWRNRIQAGDRADALRLVVACCEEARVALGTPPSAVILEFTFGATDALDDYTSYLTPDKLDDLYAMIDGNFVGLGVELKLDAEGLRIVGVIPGGPASEAGLRAGDRITGIDGKPIGGLGLDEAAGRLQGEEGSRVAITIRHPDDSTRTLDLVRRSVEVLSVAQAKIVDSSAGIGYIQLTGFQKTSMEELGKAVESLNRQGMHVLVLDLRGNPGGLLNVAVEIADRFIDKGVIVSTRGRARGQSFTYEARDDGAWSMPVAVLIDHDSASASEILAGALKDHHRAVVVGERSYGKGSVQSIFPLKSAPAGLKLTTAKFYSPRDRAYSEQGVAPDLQVRIAARPAGPDAGAPAFEFGDTDHDPVLAQAIQYVRQRSAVAR